MAGKRVLVDVDLSVSQIVAQFGVHRATAWRAKARGWLVLDYHDREVVVDQRWAESNQENLLLSAKKGVLAYLRRRAANGGRTVAEICSPFTADDVIQQALVRLLELSGHLDREKEGWRVRVAQHAAADFLDYNLVRVRGHYFLKPNGSFASVSASTEDLEREEELETAKTTLRDRVPPIVLEVASKLITGGRLTKEEKSALKRFREKWGWLRK